MSEELMTADLLDYLDASPEEEETFKDNPQYAALNVEVIRARESITLTVEHFKTAGTLKVERERIAKARAQAQVAVAAAKRAVRDNDPEAQALAQAAAAECIRTLGPDAVVSTLALETGNGNRKRGGYRLS